MKYVVVTGGVVSGVGKGVVASSLGRILKNCGINVTSIKIDPYINVDAGTFSPYEHGEVFVLDDGAEVDLDLGNYERFLDIKLNRDNNITTGKIYQEVIGEERRGDYLGRTVQVVPHITSKIQDVIETVAHRPVTDDLRDPEVCIVELGGTVGDIEGMPFAEALSQFQHRVGSDNFFLVHVSFVPKLKSTGEHKTKPTQLSLTNLRKMGLYPNLIVCRSSEPICCEIKDKISRFSRVEFRQIVAIHDVSSIYQVPLYMEQQGVIQILIRALKLDVPLPADFMASWRAFAQKMDSSIETVNIALVGKYTKLKDAYASVIKALQHAAVKFDRKLDLTLIDSENLEDKTKTADPENYEKAWRDLKRAQGVVVPGGFGARGIDGKVEACKHCRERDVPILGICLGFQTMVIEYARNVLNLKDANSMEVDPKTENPVVVDMPEHSQGDLGGTMRLGSRSTMFVTVESKLRELYGGRKVIRERHRHRYEVNPEFVERLELAGLKFVGRNDDGEGTRMEVLELSGHRYYVGTQFHPEFLTRPLTSSPPFLGLIRESVNREVNRW